MLNAAQLQLIHAMSYSNGPTVQQPPPPHQFSCLVVEHPQACVRTDINHHTWELPVRFSVNFNIHEQTRKSNHDKSFSIHYCPMFPFLRKKMLKKFIR